IALSWGSVAGSTYRVYYRRTGFGPFLLLADAIVPTSYTAMDHIALGVSYDFAVSAVNATPAESVLSSTQVATITVAAAYAVFLHIAGQTSGLGFKLKGPPTVGEFINAGNLLGFGQAAPVARYGIADYRSLTMSVLLTDPTTAALKSLQG